ncbi:LPS export ABC transporter periplasmic protein LptC [Pseudoflavitalea sp. X16]|uniref:LPS export ABC transporter periplasmic protein LptC n=1 Tax=Paraflavitalea devenefica TaxID=2716334 RepID=UPI001420EE88|nr:LPS export ABC transporter periplasmic protein LptC [Paraflavitalea devenefica]NII24720.1 LPS export ABC transporter periplasmic protein LptC [Paraflavitalea devenefica]
MQRPTATYFLRTAALLLGCFFVITACENDQAEVDNLFSRKVRLEEAKNIESYLSEKGIVKAKLTAPFMLRRQVDSAYMEFPKSLHVDFYDSTSRIESILDARYAKYFEYDRKILLKDSVVVINIINGDTLRTSELWWDQNKQEFYTTAPAHLNQRTGYLFARQGLRAAQNLSRKEFYQASGQTLTDDTTFLP